TFSAWKVVSPGAVLVLDGVTEGGDSVSFTSIVPSAATMPGAKAHAAAASSAPRPMTARFTDHLDSCAPLVVSGFALSITFIRYRTVRTEWQRSPLRVA